MLDENETGQNLTGKQLKAMPLILAAKSITEGVKKAGISKAVFYNWLKNPIFEEEFNRQRKEILKLALHELQASAGEAATVLRNLLNANNENVRLRTALGMLDHIGKFMQLEEFEQRISELERRAAK